MRAVAPGRTRRRPQPRGRTTEECSLKALDIGIAYELRAELSAPAGAPIDALEEYDSPDTLDALAGSLRALGHRPRLLGGGRAFLQAALQAPPDLVFNLSEGRATRSREAQLPAVCEMLDIPCTHSDPLAMALSLDKAMTKRVLQSAGLRTAEFRLVEALCDIEALDLPFPLFVKPLGEGSSMGVRTTSRVADHAALEREVERCLRDYRQPALVETYLGGVEATVGITGCGAGARVLGVMEIAPAQAPVEQFVYGLESKRNWRELVRYHAPPANLTPTECADAANVALGAYRALGCRDIARTDVRFDAKGRAHFMEINPLPGINPITGDIVVMAGLLGMNYTALVGAIVAAALARYPQLQ